MSFNTKFTVSEVDGRTITFEQLAEDSQIDAATFTFVLPEGSSLVLPEVGQTVTFNGHYSVDQEVPDAEAPPGQTQGQAGQTVPAAGAENQGGDAVQGG